MTPRTGSLSGRRILVTRPSGRAADLGRRIEALGGIADWKPCLRVERPASASGALDAVSRVGRFDWIVFTSVNGVEAFLSFLEEVGGSVEGIRARIAAVGPATAGRLRAAGVTVDVLAHESRAEGLVDALEGSVTHGSLILLVRPEVTRAVLADALSKMGAEVVSPPFYRSVPDPEAPEAAALLIAGAYDGVVFTSPSSFRFLREAASDRVAAFDRALARCARVAIGGVTAAALSEAGFPPSATADSPGDDGILEALGRCWGA